MCIICSLFLDQLIKPLAIRLVLVSTATGENGILLLSCLDGFLGVFECLKHRVSLQEVGVEQSGELPSYFIGYFKIGLDAYYDRDAGFVEGSADAFGVTCADEGNLNLVSFAHCLDDLL